MVIGGTSGVVMSMRDVALIQAINDLMAAAPVAVRGSHADKLINVFGTGRAANRGYRLKRYYSNGTAVTVPRWDIITIEGQDPRRVRFASGYENELPKVLLVAGAAELPRLSDAAAWYYRFDDLQIRFPKRSDDWSTIVRGFQEDLNLSAVETQSIFQRDVA